MSEMKPDQATKELSFHEWWNRDGRLFDPEPSIPWHDKRWELAGHAYLSAYDKGFHAGRASREPEIEAAKEEQMEADATLFEGERAAAEFHRVYQKEAHRRGDVRHPDDYEALSEATKEWDRVLARYCAEAIRAAHRERKEGK